VIEQCIPERVINVDYANPLPLTFTADGVKVRVPLADLLTAADGTGTLTWHAAVRRVPVIYYTDENKTVQYISTAVDYAPDVVEFNPTLLHMSFRQKILPRGGRVSMSTPENRFWVRYGLTFMPHLF